MTTRAPHQFRQKRFIFASFFAFSLFVRPPSFAQSEDNFSSDESSEISSFQRNTDDEISFSDAQNLNAAKVFVTQQEKVLNDVSLLEAKLEEKRIAIMYKLGTDRMDELANARALPEQNLLQRKRKQARIQKLNPEELDLLRRDNIEDMNTLGEKIYIQRTILGQKIEDFEVVIPGVGRAEPTSDDGIVYPRVVHEESGILFFILPNETTFDSKAMRTHIARVRTLSNLGRGRPLVLLTEHHTTIEEPTEESPTLRYRFFDRPTQRFGKYGKVNTWWRANFVAPNQGSMVIAGMSVAFQVATTEGISAANFFLHNTATWDHSATLLTAGFGTVFGLFSSFYNNATAARNPLDRKSRFAAMSRRLMISSVSFAYSLQIMNHGIHSVSLLAVGGWLTMFHLLSNSVVNNAIKDQWKMLLDIREDMGANRGEKNMLGIKVKKTQFERNVVDQVPRILKMLDLMHFTVAGAPVGTGLFYSSYFMVQYMVLKYAEKTDYKNKGVLRERWNTLVDRLKIWKYPAQVASAGSEFLQKISPMKEDASLSDLALFPKEMIANSWTALKNTWYKSPDCNESLSGKFKGPYSIDPPFRPSADGEWLEITAQ